MKLFPRFNTVYYRLIFSYIGLIMIVTILLGSLSYYYFSKNFNEEVNKVNQAKLEHMERITDKTVFEKTEQIYADLAINEFNNHDLKLLFDSLPVDKNTLINEVYHYLRGIITIKSDFLLGIDIYFAEQQMVISSTSGVKYLKDNDSKRWIQYKWLDTDHKLPQFRWLDNGPSNLENFENSYEEETNTPYSNSISFVGSYPYSASVGGLKGIIALHVNPGAVQSLITDSDREEASKVFLVSKNGTLIASNHSITAPAAYQEVIADTIASVENKGNFIVRINDEKQMVTYTTLASNGWRLIDITPIEQFYQKSSAVLRTLLWGCALAILVGIVLSNILTWQIYNPLKLMMTTSRKLFADHDNSSQSAIGNEYTFINSVINNLSIKVRDLENTITNYKPLILNQLILGLLYKTIKSEAEFREKLAFLHMEPAGKNYTCVLFENYEEATNKLDMETSQFILYRLIEFIESSTNGRRLCIAIPLMDNRVAAIINTDSGSASIKALAQDILSFIHDNFMIKWTASLGPQTNDPLELQHSYKLAENQLKYVYLFPEEHIFHHEQLTEREESVLELPKQFSQQFEKQLKLNQFDALSVTLRELIDEMIQGNYSFARCEQQLNQLVSLFHQYLKNMNLGSKDILTEPLIEQFQKIRHIEHFYTWMLQMIEKTYFYINQEANNRLTNVIRDVQLYIKNHIVNDLSLNRVAEMVSLNPSYLSKLFKDDTGINFVDYINTQRIDMAKEMILQTDKTIDEIARDVGFNSSTYFIKKFKEVNGVTPRNFKLQNLVISKMNNQK